MVEMTCKELNNNILIEFQAPFIYKNTIILENIKDIYKLNYILNF